MWPVLDWGQMVVGPQLVVEGGFDAEDGGSLSPGLAVEQVGDRLRVDVGFGGRVNGGGAFASASGFKPKRELLGEVSG